MDREKALKTIEVSEETTECCGVAKMLLNIKMNST